MKTTLLLKLYTIFAIATLAIGNLNAQVGINTTTPQPGAILDINSSNKGMLVPRVDIANLSTIAPITGGSTVGLLVYNTNATTGIGFHYWTGSVWFPILSNDWKERGNIGTNPATDFIGTADNTGLRFRTNNIERLEITNGGLFRAFSPGTQGSPLFSWDSDPDTGMFRSTTDRLNFSAGGEEFLELNENGANSEVVVNDNSSTIDFRVETDNDNEALFVDSARDNVGLGTNAPNASAQLEIADNDKGILINRVALTATNSASPITAPATGLLVYNTANSSSGSTEVLPGFYYWDGSRWIAMGGTGGKDWSLEGNAGTNPSTNFIGTTDDVDFRVRTNDTERIWVDNAGTVGIGSAPYSDTALRVNNPAQPFGVISETNSTGVALYGSDTGTGLGIYGTSANNHGIFGITSYTGSAFLIGGIIGWGSGFDGANGVLAVSDQQASTRSNMGIRAVSGSTTSISSAQILNVGVNTNATDLALYALTERPITNGIDVEAARFQQNYTGIAIDPDSRDPRAQLAGYTRNSLVGGGTMYYGAYLYSGGSNSNSSYAYAGSRYNGTNYKIIGNGAVSTIVDGTRKGESKVMFAPEAPEVLFEDYGTGKLVNGIAKIPIDPILAKNIVVDKKHPLKVFIQLEGDCNGVYVTNKSIQSFTVKELQNGNSNVSFSWHIVANRKDVVGGAESENSNYSDLRFPDAPKAIDLDKKTTNDLNTQDFGADDRGKLNTGNRP